MDRLSVQTVARGVNCLFRSLKILLDDEGQYNDKKLDSKFVLYLRAKSFNLQIQLLVKLRVKETPYIYLLYILNHHGYPLKFQRDVR
jgi:hypothetical protein